MTPCRSRLVGKCLASLGVPFAAVLTVFGQTQGPPRPEFRESTDLAHIDVVALDADRRPVRGLTAADFTLRVGGKVRTIRAFAAVDLPAPSSPSMPMAAWTRDIAPDVQTNTGPDDGRLVVIFFDRSIPPGPKLFTAQQIARAAVSELGPNDLAAVTAVRARPAQDITADRGLLLRAISDAYSGSAENNDNGVSSDPDEACYCNTCVLHQLRRIADALRNVHRRKSLLFIGSQLTTSASDITPGNPLSPDAARCSAPVTDARKAMYQALDLANVTIHSVDPSGLETPAGTSAASSLRGSAVMAAVQQGSNLRAAFRGQIRVLPERTGGRTVTNTNAPQAFVPAIFAESSGYYVLGFETPKDLVDHGAVEVTVNRRGVKVHAQRAYEPLSQRSAEGVAGLSYDLLRMSGSVGPVPAMPGRDNLAESAASGLMPVKGLPLHVNAVVFRAVAGSEHAAFVVLGFEPRANGRGGPRADASVDIFIGAFDLHANLKAARRETIQVRDSSSGVEIAFALKLKPGPYELRAGAAAGGDQVGSVVTYVDVPDFGKEGLALSGLALTTIPPGSGTVVDGADDLLPFVPTARRTFAPYETLRSYLKVYQGGTDAIARVQLEVRIYDTHGQVMLNAGGPLDAGRWNADRSAAFGLDMPLAGLAPGEYLLSLSVAEGKRTARRDVRFTVK